MFLALTLTMGVVQKTDIDKYWSTDEMVLTPMFGRYMSRDRFFAILQNFHVNDNSNFIPRNQPGYDPLHKIRPFLDLLEQKFGTVYTPERDISFDEGLCPYKGRLRFKVYNPAKPHKFGIKLFQACEASSGYCCGFEIYTGEVSSTDKQPPSRILAEAEQITNCTRTTSLVVGILASCNLLYKGYHVYMDNYYNSPELLDTLYLRDTAGCGTLRSNRKEIPEAVKRAKLREDEAIYRRRNSLLVVKYHDKRDVLMATTIHRAEYDILDKQRQDGTPILKPTCITEYVKKMGGVDVSDQIVQYYTVIRKTVKWWRKLFFHLYNLAVANAYILHNKYAEKKYSQHDFRVEVARALIEQAPNAPKPSKSGRKAVGDLCDRLTGRHFPEFIQPQPGAKKQNPTRVCYVCKPSKRRPGARKRKETRYCCPTCDKALCVVPCFRIYHTYQNYRQQFGESDSESD